MGDFDRTITWLTKHKNTKVDLRSIAENILKDLIAATPKDSGVTASLWRYEIVKNTINFYNDSIAPFRKGASEGFPIALLIQYGHSANGKWVEGIDYINPVMQKYYKDFDIMIKEAYT